MNCPQCNEDRKDTDFINSINCYKCEYANRVKAQIGNVHCCKSCGKACEKGRWAYCSDECAKEGKSVLNKNYWTAKIVSPLGYISKNSFTKMKNHHKK